MSWIKMRTSLLTDGRVRKVSAKCPQDVHAVIGRLVRLWSLGDAHADENGVLDGWSKADIDREMGCPGFCDALPKDWLESTPEGWVKLPEYHEHNGSTAKRRATEQKRKKAVRKTSAPDADKKLPRGEKRRVENIYSTPISIPLELNTPECASAWETWLAYKSKKRQSYKSADTQRQALMAAAPHGPEAFCKSITDAIKNNYAGFFPEKFSRATGQLDFHEKRAARESTVVEQAKALRAAQDAIMNPPKNKTLEVTK
jgi:hypothetical protein